MVVAGPPAAASGHCTQFSGGTIDAAGCYELTSGTTDNGSTYVTINASDVILDGTGQTVDGDLSLNPGIRIIPAPSGDVTNVTVRNLTVTDYYPGVEIEVGTTYAVGNITLRDVAVTSGSGWGVYVGDDTSTARNVSLDNVTVSGVEDGIYYERVDGGTVTNSTVESITDYGLRTRDSSDIVVIDNTFETVGEDGIIASDTANARIETNEFTDVGDDAISLGDGSANDDYPTDNGLILNNTITATGGIRLGGIGGVSNTTIRNNTITGGEDWGIDIAAGTDTSASVGNLIEDNVVRNQDGGGIYVFNENPDIDQSYSQPAIVDTILRNNTVENNDDGTGSGRGIVLANTGNVTMRNNTISGHWIDFEIDQEFGGSPASKIRLAHYRHDIDTSNTVDGDPIRYLRNASGETITAADTIGALVVVDSTDITIRDRMVTNQSFSVVNSTGLTITNLTVTGVGLDFIEVSDTLVDGAAFAPVEDHRDDVGAVGARLIETTNVTVRNATITTVADGIDARGSGSEGLLLDNISTKMNDNVVGIRLSDVNGTTITDSTVVGNNDGIDVNRATNTTIKHTTVSNNTAGFDGIGIVNNGDDTTVHNATIENNGGEGIDHGNEVRLSVTESLISTNGDDGVQLGSGDDIRIENSTISANDQYGIDLGNGDNVSILHTTVADNGLFSGVDGIRLDGTNHVIRNTTILNHSIESDSVGLFLDGASNVDVQDLTLRNNSYGLMADNADGIAVDGGTIAGGDTGLRLLAAADNVFRNVTLTGQTSWAFFQPDEGGSYRNNTATNVTFDGVRASFNAMEVGIANESTPPSDPTDRANIGTFVDITNSSAAGYANLTLSYDEHTLGGEDESALELWRYDSEWSEVTGATVDTNENTISRNITSFSIFAPFVPAVGDTTPPTADAGSDRTVDEGTTVRFNGSASTDNVGVSSYNWTFGDGSNATGETPTHTYSSPGTYTVTLNASDGAGNDDTDTLTVTVESASGGGGSNGGGSGGSGGSGGGDDGTTTVTAVETTDEETADETTDESDGTGEETAANSDRDDRVRVASASASVRGGSTLEITLPPTDDGAEPTDGEEPTDDGEVPVDESDDETEQPTDDGTTDDDATAPGATDGEAGEGGEADTDDPNQPPPPPVSQAEIERVEIDVSEDVDAEVEIRQSRSPPSDDASEFQRDDGTQPAGYIQVTDNLDDDQVTEGRLTFRVSKADLETDAADPENVALYHYVPETDEWEELDTEVVGETDDSIRFRGTTPGFSQFAAGIKRAQFEISDAIVNVQQITLGDSIQVEALVTNTGGADGTFTTQLLVDSEVVAEDVLTVASGGQRATVFDHEFDRTDTYQVRVNDVVTGEIQVIDPNAVSESTDDFLPGFGPGTAVLAVVVSTLLYRRRSR